MVAQIEELKFPAPRLMKFQMGDGTGRIIWNKVHIRPKDEHLHEFIINVLLWTLGEKWHKEQVKKSSEERHVIMRWLYARYNLLTHLSLLGKTPKDKIIPSGEVRELVALAADVYYLQLVNELPRKLVERLRSYEEFQGVRYEIAVAASLVRVGFEIEWIKTQKGAKTHEFDAVHKFTGERISVEAKSRHRPGTLHQKGEIPDLASAKADIFGLYNEAMKQNPSDKPFGVFIDINVPHQHDLPVTAKTWVEDIMQKLNAKQESVFGAAIPTFVVITNSAWHYEGKERAKPGEFMMLIPEHPLHRVNNIVTLEAVNHALTIFSDIPQED